MAILDYFNKKTADTAEKVKQQAKLLSETTRIQSMIAEEDQRIKEMYIQIGKSYLANHRDDYEKEFEDMIKAIVQSEDNIAACRKQIREIKGITICECGAEIRKDQRFCSTCGKVARGYVRCSCGEVAKADLSYCTNCGKPLMGRKAEDTSTKKTCPKCGREVPAGAAFCPGCGNEIPKDASQKNKQKICTHCGAEAETDQLFCTVCGEPLIEADTAAESIVIDPSPLPRTCPDCGAELETDVLFCTECGKRL